MYSLSVVTFSSDLSAEEKDRVCAYLGETAAGIRNITMGLKESQWRFKPGLDRWSIAEILEHVITVEGLIQGKIHNMSEAPAPPPGWDQMRTDESIPRDIPNRSVRIAAPDRIHPNGQVGGAELLGQFDEIGAKTQALVNAPALRGHVLPHPLLGLWDGYQWLMAAGAHRARHADQMLEVKADRAFPIL